MNKKFYISTTGVNSSFTLDDLGGVSVSHPITNWNLLDEFEMTEVLNSTSLQTAIDNGWVTAKNENNRNITSVEDVMVYDAAQVPFDNTGTGMASNNVKDAIHEVDGRVDLLESGVSTRLLPPVQDVTALKAINTTNSQNYPDKAMINVEDSGLYRLDRDSSAAESLPNVVQPTTGSGRWIRMSMPLTGHNNLSDLQGGTSGEYFHLTSAERAKVQAIQQVYTTAEKNKLSNIEAGATADQNASEVPYTPAVASNWNTPPNNVKSALDELASSVKQASSWNPPCLSLGDFIGQGVNYYPTNSGYEVSFDNLSNDKMLGSFVLANEGIDYDGSDIAIKIHWQLYNTTPSGTSNVKWRITYAFITSDGSENASTKQTVFTDTINVSGRTPNRTYVDVLSTISGVSGAHFLKITIERFSSGINSDTYGNYADIHSIELIKA